MKSKYLLLSLVLFVSSCSSVIKNNDKFSFDNKSISNIENNSDISSKIKVLKTLVNNCSYERKALSDTYSMKQNINTGLNMLSLAMGTANTVSIGYSAIDSKANLNFLNLIFSSLNTATNALKTVMPLEKELPEVKNKMDEIDQKTAFINKYIYKYESEITDKENIELVLFNINNDCKFSDNEKKLDIESEQNNHFDIKSINSFSSELNKKLSLLLLKKQVLSNKTTDIETNIKNLNKYIENENLLLNNLKSKKDNLQISIKSKKDNLVLETDKNKSELLKNELELLSREYDDSSKQIDISYKKVSQFIEELKNISELSQKNNQELLSVNKKISSISTEKEYIIKSLRDLINDLEKNK